MGGNMAQASASSAIRHPAALATMLTALAGYLDAVGYAELNSLFVSFMSGNTTRLGTAFAGLDFVAALAALAVIIAFLAGAIMGGFVTEKSTNALRGVLTAELVLMLGALAVLAAGQGHASMYVVAAAMGLQNSAAGSVGGVSLGKSFMTGTLVSFGQGVGKALARRQAVDGTVAYGLSWLTFVVAVVIGAFAWSSLGLIVSLTIATLIVAALLGLALARRL